MTEPRRVDRYLLGDRIGSGGMGTVYCALQLGPVGLTRPVAVKELHPHLARDADFVAMLLDEARIQGTVEHPNVVPVIDAVARGGELFLVLALVQGLSLSEIGRRLRAGARAMPAEIAVAILTGVLEGLHAAHALTATDGARLGVVHRDVSPQNVLVGADGVARVFDFGVAKSAAGRQATRDGQLKGKPSYMSPEQLDGAVLDARSDVFSAALVLAELLAGRRRPENEPAGVREWMRRELADPLRWLASINVEGALAAPIAQCLALEPGARPPTAREAATLLSSACAPATQAAVAEFLAECAADLLASGAAALRSLREAAATYSETGPTAPASPSSRRESAPSPLPFVIPIQASRGPSRALVGLAALGLALGTGGFVCGRISTSPRVAPAPEIAAGRAVEADSPRVSSPPLASPTSPLGGPPSPPLALTPSPSVSAPSGVLARRGPEAGRRAAGPVAPRASTVAAQPICDPAFVVDGKGVRVFKPECL